MRTRIADVAQAAADLLPPAKPDGSGVGANYVDAYLKQFKTTLEDGSRVACKRRGLKLTLKIGSRKGVAILRRIDHGPDPKVILRRALEEAAVNAGSTFVEEDGALFLEV